MIFIDSNVPMYLVGAPHPLKTRAQQLVERCISERQKLVTDAEVLQEILHRYTALDRRDAIQPAFDAILGIVDEVFPIEATDVDRAKAIVFGRTDLSARDALHLATMQRRSVETILTFDKGFDGIPGVVRMPSTD